MFEPTSIEPAGRVIGRWRDWLIGGLVLALLLLWVRHQIGWRQLLAPWRDFALADLFYLLSLSLLSYLLRALRVYDYFHARLRGQFPQTLRLTVLHNFANNLLPMRAGEAAFPILMRRYFGQGLADSALALLWIRGLDLHFLLLVALGALWLRESALFWLLAMLAWLSSLLLVYPLRRPLLERACTHPGRTAALARRVLETLPRSQGAFLRLYLWTLLTWISKIIAFAAVLTHFLPLPTWQALLGVMGSELSSVLPIHGLAGSGSYELAMAAVLVPLGHTTQAVVTGAVNLHLFLLGVTLLLGLSALLLPRPASPHGGSRP